MYIIYNINMSHTAYYNGNIYLIKVMFYFQYESTTVTVMARPWN